MPNITKKILLDHFKNQPKLSATAQQPSGNLTLASVLIPIIDEPELMVLFTQRTEHLTNHPGQISFPGGRMEKKDKDLQATALRETQEEVGLMPEDISIIGSLGEIISRTGFLVTPYIGLITPPLKLIIDPCEVAAVFTAPLNFVLDPKNHQTEIYRHGNLESNVYVINYQEHRIWGMTAAILVKLGESLRSF